MGNISIQILSICHRFGSTFNTQEMKQMLVFMTIAMIGVVSTSLTANQNNSIQKAISGKRNKCVQANASLQKDKILFRITMSNDYGTGYYGLKRINTEGQVELIECREIRNGQSLRTYVFEDPTERSKDCTYTITRVDVLKQKKEVIAAWDFDSSKNALREFKK